MSTVQDAHVGDDVASEVWGGRFGFAAGALSSAPSAPVSNDTAVEALEYEPELSTRQLIAQVRTLLATERRAERLICRYLADLADRIRQRQDAAFGAYADELHAARCFFGLGVRDTRERVRIGRALRELPQIERAFIDGELSFSRVREITRAATAETEHEWLDLAQRLDMRSLERRVVIAGEAALGDGEREQRGRRLDEPARTEWISPKTLRVTFELSTDAWGLLERALQGARRESGSSLSDGEALEGVARDALLVQTQDIEASDPRRAVVMYECLRCGQSELDTGAGARELEVASAAALACGATVHDLRDEGRAVSRGGPLPAAVRRAVMLRDRCRCRVPGCGRRRYVDVHHVLEQARGGEHSRRNCLVLCTTHHRLLHEGKLRVEGDADGELHFHHSTGAPLVHSAQPSTAAQQFFGPMHEHAGSCPAADRRYAPQLGSSGEADRPDSEVVPNAARPRAGGTPNAMGTQHTRLERAASSLGLTSEPASRLLEIMGRRGGWSADALIQASGLAAAEVFLALTLLEIAKCVRWRDFMLEPV